MSQLTIRRATGKDLHAILDLFESSIRGTCTNDYSPEQIEVWVASREDEDRWLGKITRQHFILAESDGHLAGMGSLDSDYLDVMFVHPHFQGRGVAKTLLAEIERKAQEAGVELLSSDVSLTARPFFDKSGFVVKHRNHNERSGEVLVNFRMVKKLDTKSLPDRSKGEAG